MMRKQASIEIIRKVEPVEDADRIVLAHVLGWRVPMGGGFRSHDDAERL